MAQHKLLGIRGLEVGWWDERGRRGVVEVHYEGAMKTKWSL
ncbi:MAG: hypothetical protein C5S38_01860 [Candidatus Methanophagaceae archaeon]|nr:MAG: hypothetical protein C5S38_01860 [Methanophagales archaeon]